MSDNACVYEAFLHFYHLDRSNAAIHVAEVRYSPITFRLASWLHDVGYEEELVYKVLDDRGLYEEDKGR